MQKKIIYRKAVMWNEYKHWLVLIIIAKKFLAFI